MRKIITYSTLGDNMKEVFSAAMTWGDLQADLATAGIRFEGMRVMTNPGQVTLESLQAELPQGEFQLFIMPNKVKSGYNLADDDEDYEEESDPISHDEIDWENNDPEDYEFVSQKDFAIACVKRATALLNKSSEILANNSPQGKPSNMQTPSRDPILDNLRQEAAKLQRNLDMFN